MENFASLRRFLDNPVEVSRILVESVIAEFILDSEKNDETAGYTDGQAGDVDERIKFVFFEVSESDFCIVFDHLNTPIQRV